MSVPTIMTAAEWKRRTSRTGHKRGDALQVIDGELALFETPAGCTPNRLESLEGLLAAWMQSKTTNSTFSSIRDHKGAVTELRRQLATALQLNHATQWSSAYPRIYISTDTYRGRYWVPDDFRGEVKTALAAISSKPIGRKMLTDMSQRCVAKRHKVVIEYSGAGSSAAPVDRADRADRKMVQVTTSTAPSLNAQDLLKNPKLIATIGVRPAADQPRDYVQNDGTSAVVTWNHKDPGLDGRPAFIALAHELVHAFHFVTGSCFRAATGYVTDGDNTGIMEEEMRTVGFGKYASESPSENAIRGEHAVALRTSYMKDISFANVTSSLRD
jgi:hypothetical protein